jgi:uncharacterized damage-inducible protein DinB
MSRLRSFGAFWYDFVVGDDWRIPVVVVIGLAVTAVLAHRTGVSAWWVMPIVVGAALATSLRGVTIAQPDRPGILVGVSTLPFPSPTTPVGSRSEVFLGYLEFYRDRLLSKLRELPAGELRRSRLPSGWTPIELLKHLRYVEVRWLEWGFEGRPVDDPWGDRRDDRWYVGPDESLDDLAAALDEQAERSRVVVESHDLSERGMPGPRWDGAEPATLERVLFHLVQEYARHVGQLDIVVELAVDSTGE